VIEALAAALMVLGSLFLLASAAGVLRFPDTLARAHALGVGWTLGAPLVMLGLILGLGDLAAGAKAMLTIVFLYLTSPVGSHMLGRAAYRFARVPMNLRVDELEAHEAEVAEDASS
jgi:multicomponent Na+:H+ antiporter subunit G